MSPSPPPGPGPDPELAGPVRESELAGPGLGTDPAAPARFCDRCGEPAESGPHPACAAARALEPPRYCPDCRRRMTVQILPAGWSARCVQHGHRHG